MDKEDLEELRIKAYHTNLSLMVILSILNFIYLACTFNVIIFLIIFLFIVVVLPEKQNIYTGRYKFEYKKFLVVNSLKSIMKNVKYLPEEGISIKVIKNSTILCNVDKYKTYDKVTAVIDEMRFESSKFDMLNEIRKNIILEWEDENAEKNLNQRVKFKKNSVHHQIFSGQWITFNLKDTFRTNLLIVQDGFSHDVISSSFNEGIYQCMSFGSDKIDKEFELYIGDEYCKKEIFDEDLLFLLNNLVKLNGSKVAMAIYYNKLHFIIDENTNQKEMDMLKPSILREIKEDKLENLLNEKIKALSDIAININSKVNIKQKKHKN